MHPEMAGDPEPQVISQAIVHLPVLLQCHGDEMASTCTGVRLHAFQCASYMLLTWLIQAAGVLTCSPLTNCCLHYSIAQAG